MVGLLSLHERLICFHFHFSLWYVRVRIYVQYTVDTNISVYLDYQLEKRQLNPYTYA